MDFESLEGNIIVNFVGEIFLKLSEKLGLCLFKRLNFIRFFEMNRIRIFSEVLMDVVYFDKIFELDLMMLELDNSKSFCNNGFKSVDLDGLFKSF